MEKELGVVERVRLLWSKEQCSELDCCRARTVHIVILL